MKKRARVVVVDGCPMFRECLVSALSVRTSLPVEGAGMDADEIARALAGNSPQVVLIDIGAAHQQTLNMIEFIGREFPKARIIAGVKEEGPAVLTYIERGASGYFISDASLEELIAHIQTQLRGETMCSPRVAYAAFLRLAELAPGLADEAAYKTSVLTPREMEVLQLMVEGMSNKEIAQKIFLSLHTVKNHVHKMLKELGMRNRFELAQYAIDKGLVLRKSRHT
jgi:DNA-binding NarL/FixJ family response regulator